MIEELGMDAMSAGVVMGWATEASMRGIVTEKETIVPLKFGDKDGYLKALQYTACQENDFYAALGKGVDHASSIYGGADFAMQIAGNEMAGYHTGYGALVGMACGARHSHLCNGGYSIDQGLKAVDLDVITNKLFQEEIDRCMLNSLVMCLFARKVYDRETILMALGSPGVPVYGRRSDARRGKNICRKDPRQTRDGVRSGEGALPETLLRNAQHARPARRGFRIRSTAKVQCADQRINEKV